MKKSIEAISVIFKAERSNEKEEDLIVEFEQLLDWIQGHDGGLRRINVT